MKKGLLWFLIFTTAVLLLWGAARAWHRQQSHEAALAEDSVARQNQRIRIAADEILVAEQRTLPLQVPMSGTLQATHSVSIKAQSGGQIQHFTLREGEPVKAGQVLFSVVAPDAAARVRQAQQQARTLQAQLEVARRDAENNRQLADQGFISPTALANSDANLQAALASHAAAHSDIEVARKSFDDTRAVSPINGIVSARHVQPGEVLSPGQEVLEIVDPSQFEIHAEVSPADSLQVQVGQPASFTLEDTGEPLAAVVTRISPSAQAGSRSVAVYLQVLPWSDQADRQAKSLQPKAGSAALPGDQPHGRGRQAYGNAPLQLRDGLFARGDIQVGEVDAVAVPQTAIRTNAPHPYVMTLDEDQVVRHQPVEPRQAVRLDARVWQLVGNLQAGTRILGASAGLLGDGTAVQLEAAPAPPPARHALPDAGHG